MCNKDLINLVVAGLVFGIGFCIAEQLVWMFFDQFKMSIGMPLG